MKRWNLIAAALVSVCICTSVSADQISLRNGVDGYTGTKDTFLWANSPNDNYGALGRAFCFYREDSVGHYFNGGRMLVSFEDINIPVGSVINSATMKVYVDSLADNGGCQIACYGLLKDWGEGSSTDWGQQSVGGASWDYNFYNTSNWTVAGADGAGTDRNAVADDTQSAVGNGLAVSWDVTNSFKSQFEQGNLYGWVLSPLGTTYNTGAIFHTSETNAGVDYVPVLTIDYTTPTAVPEPSSALAVISMLSSAGFILRRKK